MRYGRKSGRKKKESVRTHSHKQTHTPRLNFLKIIHRQTILYHSGKKGNRLYPSNDYGEESKNAPETFGP